MCFADGGLDVLDGSPPCAAYTQLGRRERTWGRKRAYSDTAQQTDDLFGEYVRLVRHWRPKVFVAENVAGLVRGKAKGKFLQVLKDMRAAGYRVEARMLDAQWLGVPQARQRLYFMGVRNDLAVGPAWPEPRSSRVTVKQVLTDVIRIEVDRITAVTHGRASGGVYRPSVNRPIDTVTTVGFAGDWRGDWKFAFNDGGPPRGLRIAELKLLCGFPADYVLTGSFAQQWERLGRSCPPPVSRAIAETIRERVLSRASPPLAADLGRQWGR